MRKSASRITIFQWSRLVLYHVVVATGVAMIGVGATALQSDDPTASELQMLQAGIGILTASWVLLILEAAFSFLPTRSNSGRVAWTCQDGAVVCIAGINYMHTCSSFLNLSALSRPINF